MLKNYWKIALRNLWKNKVYSLINILGLAIGMATCLFIFQYIRFEVSYDRWQKNAGRLYRVPMGWGAPFSDDHASATSYFSLGPAMKADFPEIEDFARITPLSTFATNSLMSYTDDKGQTKRFNEQNIYIADASFFHLFSFPFVQGSPAGSMMSPHSIVISQKIASKYFGNSDPMGKTLLINNEHLKVTGVLKDVPENSHLKFDMLISLGSPQDGPGHEDWGNPGYYNYVLLAPGQDPKKIEAKFQTFIDKHLGAKIRELNIHFTFKLQPVTDIHLRSAMSDEAEANGSEKMLYFFTILGIFILVVAWINYINLSTARSMERAREGGVRKVAGATRMQLLGQFMLESLLINTVAVLLSVVIVITLAPFFDRFVGRHISAAFLSSGLLHAWKFWLIALGVFMLGAVQVGAYPAFILSAFKPALVLKGVFHRSSRGILLRKSLVTFQFILSILLIAGTIIVYRQLIYMRNQDPGYNKDQMLVVNAPAIRDSTFFTRTDYFKTELKKDPGILQVAPSSGIPGKAIGDGNGVRMPDQAKGQSRETNLLSIDKDFLSTYQIKLACGANLPENDAGNIIATKHAKVMINESLVRSLRFKNNEAALHQNILLITWVGDVTCEIIGVVKDYHQRSLRESYEPILYYHSDYLPLNYFSIRVNAKDLRPHMAYIEDLYNKVFPGNAFESFFLDDYFDRQYQADQQFAHIFSLFTILAIFISCLGLVGLSTFAIKLRTKEISIRKVLGASVPGIVYSFYRDFIKLVVLASLVAIPIVWFVADKWLRNFAFHIRLEWYIFIVAPLLLVVISLITISLQSLRAALANPVNSLRKE